MANSDEEMDWKAFDALTDEEVLAAALSDPDAQPSPEGSKMRRIVRSKWLRIKLGVTQQELSDRYNIPLSVLLAWERHEAEPDAVARAYLDAIAGDPEAVARALALPSQSAQAAE